MSTKSRKIRWPPAKTPKRQQKRVNAMEFTDTDSTQTNWDEFKLQNKSECCPVTGVSRSLSFAQIEHSDAVLLASQIESGRESNLKLQTLFDKFLYQK